MNFNIKFFLLCPIADEQKPINEYINLKEKEFTNLILLNSKNYFLKIFYYFICFFLLGFPLTFLLQLKSKVILFSIFFSLIILSLIFLINFSSWFQIFKRFRSSRLFYEEGSWYDGQIWEKPMELIKNDKLISILKIKPILKRILKTLNILSFLTLIIAFNYI
jgi:hypothetical protein